MLRMLICLLAVTAACPTNNDGDNNDDEPALGDGIVDCAVTPEVRAARYCAEGYPCTIRLGDDDAVTVEVVDGALPSGFSIVGGAIVGTAAREHFDVFALASFEVQITSTACAIDETQTVHIAVIAPHCAADDDCHIAGAATGGSCDADTPCDDGNACARGWRATTCIGLREPCDAPLVRGAVGDIDGNDVEICMSPTMACRDAVCRTD